MANMSLGGYTFECNPSDPTLVKPEKSASWEETYSSVAFFSWGVGINGKVLALMWEYMPSLMFDELDTLYRADAAVVFDPQDDEGKTYNVEILELDGKYFQSLKVDAEVLRKDVKLTLLILSEV